MFLASVNERDAQREFQKLKRAGRRFGGPKTFADSARKRCGAEPQGGDASMLIERPGHYSARRSSLRALDGKTCRSGGLRAVLAILAVFSGQQAAVAVDEWGRIRLAQRTDARIWVAAEFVARPASEISLSIRVGPSEALPRNSFVRLRGLPHVVSLNEGYSIGPGSWAIPLSALPMLKANIPASIAGRSELVISIVGVDGIPLAEAKTTLIIEPLPSPAKPIETPPAEPTSSLRFAAPAPPPAAPNRRNYAAPRLPELSIVEREKGEQLVQQGDQYLAQGKIGGARLFYRQAANAGYALAAIRLGATYDPAELSRLRVEGMTPDAVEARKWYERARELGAPEADERLARLSGY
jgi:hypothetical protein